jgi:hypothetical protein
MTMFMVESVDSLAWEWDAIDLCTGQLGIPRLDRAVWIGWKEGGTAAVGQTMGAIEWDGSKVISPVPYSIPYDDVQRLMDGFVDEDELKCGFPHMTERKEGLEEGFDGEDKKGKEDIENGRASRWAKRTIVAMTP